MNTATTIAFTRAAPYFKNALDDSSILTMLHYFARPPILEAPGGLSEVSQECSGACARLLKDSGGHQEPFRGLRVNDDENILHNADTHDGISKYAVRHSQKGI